MPRFPLSPRILAVGLTLPGAAFAGLSASQDLAGTLGRLSDGDLATAWQVPQGEDATGQFVEVSLPPGPVRVTALSMTAGWDGPQWDEHPHVRSVELEFIEGHAPPKVVATRQIELKDTRGVQRREFEPVSLSSSARNVVRVHVRGLQPGEVDEDLAISELFLHLQDRPVPAVWKAPAGIREVSDGKPETVFKAETGASLSTNAEGMLLSRIGVQGGPANRPETVWVTVGGFTRQHTLANTGGVQWIELPVCHQSGHTGSCSGPVKLEFSSTWGSGHEVQIAELQLMATGG